MAGESYMYVQKALFGSSAFKGVRNHFWIVICELPDRFCVLKVWALASKRFIAAASGNVLAFVTGADPRSTFVSVELPHILQNENIKQINGEDKFVFAKRFSR